MTYKIIPLIIPFVVSSIVSLPTNPHFDSGKVLPSKPFSFISINDSDLPPADDYFSCTTFGPFSLSTVTNSVSVTFTYQYGSIVSQNIVERVRLLDSTNTVVGGSSKQYRYYTKGTRNNVTFSLPIKDHLNRNGLTLKFEILKESNLTILKAYSTTFYPTSDENVSWVSLKQNVRTSKSLGFYSDDSEMKPIIEKLDFTHFGDYIDIDYYYRLEINKNLIGYPNDCTFRYKSASLTFNDSNNLFPYLSHQASGDVVIPLTLTRSGDFINLKYKNNFYINKRTLQISESYRNGFVSTKDFYLPINGKNKFNGKQIYIALEGFGLDNISTTIPLKYDTNRSLVGTCTDGDYCVIGGRR